MTTKNMSALITVYHCLASAKSRNIGVLRGKSLAVAIHATLKPGTRMLMLIYDSLISRYDSNGVGVRQIQVRQYGDRCFHTVYLSCQSIKNLNKDMPRRSANISGIFRAKSQTTIAARRPSQNTVGGLSSRQAGTITSGHN